MKEPYTFFFAKLMYLFQLHNFSHGLTLKKLLSTALQKGVREGATALWGQESQELCFDWHEQWYESGWHEPEWRVTIPGQAWGQREWPGSGTDQLKGSKTSSQLFWVRMRTFCPHIYLHSCGVAQAGTYPRLRKPSRSGIPYGIKTNSGKKVQGLFAQNKK